MDADLSALEWIARATTYGAALLLFGAVIFVLYVPRQALRAAGAAGFAEWRALHRLVLGVEIGCVVALALGGVLAFALHAAAIAGVPVARIFASAQGAAVLRDTLFGQVSAVRFALVVVLALMLLPGRRVVAVRAVAADDVVRATLAGLVLATLPWIGHAVASSGVDRYVQVATDTLHLLAAGAWLGALPPLGRVLSRAAAAHSAPIRAIAAQATQRFSRLGIVCVVVLVATGAISSWYLVARPAALVGTHYGQLLLVKLALFAAMILYATENRFRHTPRIAAASAAAPVVALRRVARNAALETVLGLAIVGIVAVLGALGPAAHAGIVWPLPFTFDWDIVTAGTVSGWRVIALIAGGVATLALARVAAHRPRLVGRVLALAASSVPALAAAGWLLAVPAVPTTYAQSSVRYTAQSIARGSALFALHCADCHGAAAKGDGPAAASLPVPPANLMADHMPARTPGDLYWWVSHGIAGTPMPGFADSLSVTQRWDVINLLRARVEAGRARSLTTIVLPRPSIVAPDFAFELEQGEAETLAEQRGHSVVLLAFFTLPTSEKRLADLAAARERLERSGVRIIAFPLRGAGALRSGHAGIERSILALPDPAVATTYALFLQAPSGALAAGEPSHAELLIDRNGYIRARWLSAADASDNAIAELLRASERANALPPGDSDTPPHHAH